MKWPAGHDHRDGCFLTREWLVPASIGRWESNPSHKQPIAFGSHKFRANFAAYTTFGSARGRESEPSLKRKLCLPACRTGWWMLPLSGIEDPPRLARASILNISCLQTRAESTFWSATLSVLNYCLNSARQMAQVNDQPNEHKIAAIGQCYCPWCTGSCTRLTRLRGCGPVQSLFW